MYNVLINHEGFIRWADSIYIDPFGNERYLENDRIIKDPHSLKFPVPTLFYSDVRAFGVGEKIYGFTIYNVRKNGEMYEYEARSKDGYCVYIKPANYIKRNG